MNFGALCRCCLIHPPDNDLKKPYTRLQRTEIYADMLKECFEIHVNKTFINYYKFSKRSDMFILLEADDSYQGICKICVVRLRDALDFKQQVITCQKQLLLKNVVADEMLREGEEEVKVKEELPEHEHHDDFDLHLYDVKEELPDLDCLKEEILSLDKVKVKRKSKKKKNGKNRSSDRNGRKTRKSTESLLKKLSSLTNFTQDTSCLEEIDTVSESTQYKQNIQNILKYSNCTPFFNKTIAGIACAYCKELYKDIKLLQNHTSEKHANCDIDNKKYDRDSLSIKLDISDLKCSICNVQINVIADLKSHLSKEHSIKFYPVNDYFLEFKLSDSDILNCALCNSTFETFKMLLQHMNGHYRNYICDVCDLGFINRQRLKIHKKTHDLGSFKCSFCDKVFSTKVRLKCHEKYSHNTGPRYTTNCSQCEKSFTSYYQRNRHMTAEHNVSAATYKCNICDTFFILKSKLTSHIKKVHLMERNHTCTQCGQGFFTQHSLDDHMIKHNGERVFECTVCHKAYARKKTLREHMRIHNNDRRFKCGVCGMAFVQKCSMKSHMLSNHGVNLSEFENARNGISRPANYIGTEG